MLTMTAREDFKDPTLCLQPALDGLLNNVNTSAYTLHFSGKKKKN